MSSLYLPQCPLCRHHVVWQFVLPKKAEFCCQHCAHVWKVGLVESKSAYGVFLGPWSNDEMTKLEENIRMLVPDEDWTFFKGRKVWTAWQAMRPEKLIMVNSLDELVYWIAHSLSDGDWYKNYRDTYKKPKDEIIAIDK